MVQLNLYSEMMQSYMLSQFNDSLLELGLGIEDTKDKIKIFTTSLTLQDFDNKCLKFEKFLKFCEFIEVLPSQLCDKYYCFIFSDYGEALMQYREENNLTQKKCAKILKISPADIGLFEKALKYPTRAQFLKLKEVLKQFAK